MHGVRGDLLLEYCQRRAYLYFWPHLVMLKAFDDITMSKCMYIKEKNLIVTASRGRRVKVSNYLASFGRSPSLGEMLWPKWSRKGR